LGDDAFGNKRLVKHDDLHRSGRAEMAPGGKRAEMAPGGKRAEMAPGGKRAEMAPGGKRAGTALKMLKMTYEEPDG
jgi:hypothetical protein